MSLLRKTGARLPWLPGPLRPFTVEQVRRAIVVAAALPPILLGGNTQWVGARPFAAAATAARPAVVVRQAAPFPGATVVQLTAPRDVAPAPPDRLSPAQIVGGQQPLPSAQYWRPAPLRQANTDPLRPPIVLAEPPDATLVQPSALLVGRLPRNEDTSRPARPAAVITATPPLPGAITLALSRPRDEAVVQPDRLAPPIIISVARLPERASVLWSTAPRDGAAPAGRAPVVVRPAQAPPAASTAWLSGLRRAAPDRAGQAPQAVVPVPQPPGAILAWLRTGLDETAPLPPITCAVATLSQHVKPLAMVAFQAKPLALLAPAARLATLTQQVKPLALVTQQTKPIARLEDCRG